MQYPTTFASLLSFSLYSLLLHVGGSWNLQHIRLFALSHHHAAAHITPYLVTLLRSIRSQETWEGGAAVEFLEKTENVRKSIIWQSREEKWIAIGSTPRTRTYAI